jgi:prepilin-type N-terminal cleavage/methylation domain-containing protein
MTKNKKGFTIIEVVLVLAIAGLIFLMVFIALPALQRSQRNTQREDDLSRVLTAANDYQTNNNGKSPWDDGKGKTDKRFVKRYIDSTCDYPTQGDGYQYTCTGNQFRDPDGEPYSMMASGSLNKTTALANFRAAEYNANGTIKNDKYFELRKASVTTSGGVSTTNYNDPTFDHTFYAVTYATCGDEGKVVKGTGNRQYAVMYVLEGNAISCNDNH